VVIVSLIGRYGTQVDKNGELQRRIPQMGISQRHLFRFRQGRRRPGENERDDAGKSPLGEFYASIATVFYLLTKFLYL